MLVSHNTVRHIKKQFSDNNESLQRIEELVKKIIEQRLMNHRHVLLLVLQSIIDSCRRDPIKFNILYHNLSADAITREIRLAEFGNINQYNYGQSTNDHLCYQQKMLLMTLTSIVHIQFYKIKIS
jgi:hypothetical protein